MSTTFVRGDIVAFYAPGYEQWLVGAVVDPEIKDGYFTILYWNPTHKKCFEGHIDDDGGNVRIGHIDDVGAEW